jgi:Thiol-activated cytolysin
MYTRTFALVGTAFFTLAACWMIGCKKEDFDFQNKDVIKKLTEKIDTVKRIQLDSIFRVTLGPVPQPGIVPVPKLLEDKSTTEQDSIRCSTKTYEWAPGREESLLMDPTAEVITEGQLIRAESITEGAYTPIIVPRRPVCISLSLSNINGAVKDTIFDPAKRSSALEARQRLLSRQLKGNAPARVTKQIEKIYSYEQCKVAVGANYSGFSFDVAASFGYANTRIKSRYLVKFFQEYYSISIDLPAKPSDFFKEVPNASLLGSYSPVYVSNIKYGRVLLFLLESEKSESEMNASIEASFNGFAASGGFNAEYHLKRVMENCSMKLFVVGGSAPDAVGIQKPADVENYIKQGANFSNESPGVPIAYTLRFLKDNSVAKIIMNSKYTVRQCEVIPAITTNFQPVGSYEWPAKLIRGDSEYGGDGNPHITTNVDLYIVGDREVWMRVNILFEEKRADFTTGGINENRKLYTAPAGHKIIRIASQKHWDHFYIEPEGDHGPNTFDFSDDKLVSRLILNGDTGGDDLPCDKVGDDRSWAKLFLNEVVVALRKEQ